VPGFKPNNCLKTKSHRELGDSWAERQKELGGQEKGSSGVVYIAIANLDNGPSKVLSGNLLVGVWDPNGWVGFDKFDRGCQEIEQPGDKH
jgi:hypothetical protein